MVLLFEGHSWLEDPVGEVPRINIGDLVDKKSTALSPGSHFILIVPSDTSPEKLERVSWQPLVCVAVEIYFEKFSDGRGFSLAKLLRDKLSFKKQIRATGELIPDQWPFLLDCGFSAVLQTRERIEHFGADSWLCPTATRYRYQPAMNKHFTNVWQKRHQTETRHSHPNQRCGDMELEATVKDIVR